MPKQVVILHGWSDDSDSFKPLANFLRKNGYRTASIFLGDYISLRNDVTIDDVAKRMEEIVQERRGRAVGARGRLDPSFHLVVHSTGGLVARRWICRYYGGKKCPARNLVMLAPANFGSVLAHKGRSLLAKVAKGWRTGFETGDEMLYALEIGSPFQWELAQEDLFSAGAGSHVYYGEDKVRPFVITGTHPYSAKIRKLINENGSDGTIRVAAANLNTRGLTVDFSGDPQNLINPQLRTWSRRGGRRQRFPLAVVPDRDHTTIKEPDQPGYAEKAPDQQKLGQLILQALGVTSAAGYRRVRDAFDAVTADTRTFAGSSPEAAKHRRDFFGGNAAEDQYFHEHYQVHVRARDEFGDPIEDYFLTFMPQWKKKRFFGLKTSMPPESAFFHDEVIAHVHRHRRARSHVSFYLDRYDLMRRGGFYDQLAANKVEQLGFTVSADSPGDRVAYFSRARNRQQGLIPLHDRQSKANRWLQKHCTHFMELVIPRAAVPEVFRLKPD